MTPNPVRGPLGIALAVFAAGSLAMASAPGLAKPGHGHGTQHARKAQEVKVAPAKPGQIAMRHVDSWGYQLQNVRPRLVTKDGLDLLVVDYSRDGTEAGALNRADVDTLRKRTREPDRIVLAYLSIGEAEDYRYYWHSDWSEKPADDGTGKPAAKGFAGASDGVSVGMPNREAPRAKLGAAAPPWLADENQAWRGNYLVRYWDAGWQAIIFGSPTAYLDKIIEAGFDGVYLDKIDSNDDWQKTRPAAEREMVDFVKKLAQYARQKRQGFRIVPQNGEDLLKYPDYVAVIDGIAKEDLLYGGNSLKDGEPNSEPEILKTKRLLDKARRAGKLVLTVEYLEDIESILAARKRMRTYDYVPFFARRALGEAPLFPPARNSRSNSEPTNKAVHD